MRISIHSTARVETCNGILHVISSAISIHSTARVETRQTPSQVHRQQFQSTPPRGWRPGNRAEPHGKELISIHSTARVETKSDRCEGGEVAISIHSTARVETRHSPYSVHEKLAISIHSTARVETITLGLTSPQMSYFNPLHREGGDPDLKRGRSAITRFQSTPPRGWRPKR